VSEVSKDAKSEESKEDESNEDASEESEAGSEEKDHVDHHSTKSLKRLMLGHPTCRTGSAAEVTNPFTELLGNDLVIIVLTPSKWVANHNFVCARRI
jgi:hypothetical protein